MNQQAIAHLTQSALLRWLAGDVSEEERTHMMGCPQCQAHASPVAESLAWFRDAAHQWSEEKAAARQKKAAHFDVRRLSPYRSLRARWMTVGVVAGIIVAVLVGLTDWNWQSRRAVEQSHVRKLQAEQQMAQDNSLLEAIDRDISQTVPAAMEPLVRSEDAWQGRERRTAIQQ